MGLPTAHRFSETVEKSEEVRVLWIEKIHHQEAIELMAAHKEKTWSLTDCASFVVMQEMGIRTALALDTDFAQTGFDVVP